MSIGEKTNSLSSSIINSKYSVLARLIPALASLLPLLPVTFVLGATLEEWQTLIGDKTGIFVLFSFVLTTLASAMGNRLQNRLWPDWPFDAPSNVQLMPDNPHISSLQRTLWYTQIKQVTGLDIQSEVENGDHEIIRITVNDSVVNLRNQIRSGPLRSRHDRESANYGGVRNLTGMRSIWLCLSVLSLIGCWISYFMGSSNLFWPIIASIIPFPLLFIAFKILPSYVKTRAGYYCEVLFQLLKEESERDVYSIHPNEIMTKTLHQNQKIHQDSG